MDVDNETDGLLLADYGPISRSTLVLSFLCFCFPLIRLCLSSLPFCCGFYISVVIFAFVFSTTVIVFVEFPVFFYMQFVWHVSTTIINND